MRRFSLWSGSATSSRCSTPVTSGTVTPRFCSSSNTGKKITDSPGKRKTSTAKNVDVTAGTLRPSGRRSHLSIRCTTTSRSSSSSASGGSQGLKEELRSYFSDDYIDLYQEASSQLNPNTAAADSSSEQPLVVPNDDGAAKQEASSLAAATSSTLVPTSQEGTPTVGTATAAASPRTRAAYSDLIPRVCPEEKLTESLFRPSLGCPTEIALQLRSQQKNLVGAVGPYDNLTGVGGISPMLLSWQLFDRYDSYAVAPRSLPVVGFTPPPSSLLHNNQGDAGQQESSTAEAGNTESDIIWV